MTTAPTDTPTTPDLLHRMLADRQVSPGDLRALEAAGARAPWRSEDAVLRWVADEYDVEFHNLDNVELDKEVLSLFPARVLLKDELLPLDRQDGTVRVATSRLFATQALDSLRTLTGLRLEPVLAPSEAIQREMKKHLGIGADTIDTLGEEARFQVVDEAAEDDTDLDNAAEDASIIRFVNQVLRDAIELRASDIHLEPFEDSLRIRYRIDGVLQEVPVPPQVKRFQPAIVSRVKILSHLNIAEKRLPQDGRIKLRLDEGEVDIRVSVIPMLHGEAVVLRLLRQTATLRGMKELGLDDREYRGLRRVLSLPHGIVLVTGPTGSGKTSTLYTALQEINDHVRKIITIEDPIEYQLKGVNQIQVSEKSGLTFARGLRSILRHDPDVILIGEIRDQETAQIAVQASLTGHLVFSTIHTNSAPATFTRLIDMGVEPFLVASSLVAIVAQRLVRQLCPHCKETYRPSDEELHDVGLDPATFTGQLWRAVGCPECNMKGYRGRMGIYELLVVSERIRAVVTGGKDAGVIRKVAIADGMRTLRDDGIQKALEGRTSLDEVMRVTQEDVVELD